jgi:hypothetical protein
VCNKSDSQSKTPSVVTKIVTVCLEFNGAVEYRDLKFILEVLRCTVIETMAANQVKES